VANDIDKAESEYSKKRLGALCTEWIAEHPNLEICIESLRRLPTRIAADDLSYEFLEPTIDKLFDKPDAPDSLPQLARAVVEDTKACDAFREQLLGVLYKVGAIGIRLRNGEAVHFIYDSTFIFRPTDITSQTRVSISPMLWSVLGSYRQRRRTEALD